MNELQIQDYTVIVNRIGTAPREQCTVVADRPGQTYSRADTDGVRGREVSRNHEKDIQLGARPSYLDNA
jgi:hypothetical protein